MEIITKRNNPKPIKNNFLKLVSDLYLWKKITVTGIISNRLSYLTIDDIPRITNEKITCILFLLKNNAKKFAIKKMNKDSVKPKNEFSTIYGENIKKDVAINAKYSLKNFLVRK